ncbi:relaxase/mobilization nuclease domain-containing protein [Streptomyces acidiscabies]|uniref:Relaxase/mobilization nuclease domain-containing protein n=1 Tax=Streptomyces acidiscabies TaxID=42234 RepID=A0AAP6EL78_9ACTN|nr:relaxase/mobilization nuclease domain-containing protein [Streptomyces acidiscabies]MBP5936733.1 relaxase/mobilization nuclease domain-containing protein [Streptomyces sp. LBUM 1476]MBZ3915261.1 relaxase/mobilization nuclease domain-containing protein [Streptomyces acidiscabies]MDX2967022.1 relaxase/mobilization nuclease domain-containing protein [Streptomyces acidiscabies]MDX3021323.1 relaxase/mobilization nuclease domain-containing protein [Streptomyces acidiscabies]MDX3793424.1 relaxase/
MNPNVTRGDRTYGLLAYLYGPGRHNEHTDPHLVASWDGFAPDPGRDPDATLKHLATALDLRVKQAGDKAPAKHVWHCSIRTAPEDRHFTDEEWAMIARRVLAEAGIARDDDPDSCRWVAVRHADDHIHIAATLVRGDLRRARINNDWPKVQAACRTLEKELGLRRQNTGDGTAAKRATAAERRKAERTGRAEPPRDTLRTVVRQSLAAAATETEFFDTLTRAGLRVRLRHAPSGDTLGYSVALPDDHNAQGEPVWYAGTTLAPDLSLPKIRTRLATTSSLPAGTDPATARRRTTARLDEALLVLAADEDEAADDLTGTGAVLDALAATAHRSHRAELLAAARTFERATRSHVRAENTDRRALRSAARGILHAGTALGRGEDGGTTAMILSTLVLMVLAAARWHAARGHAQQAAAAHQTAVHLRAAYHRTATTPLTRLRGQAEHLPATERRHYDTTIRTTLTDTGHPDVPMPALAATLAEAQAAGHDPDTLLREAASYRELDTADSVEHVLVWRIRRLARLPASPALVQAPSDPDPSAAGVPAVRTRPGPRR